MSNETLDDAGVIAKFGVRPDQVLDFLTLTGDSVDNMPGVPKVGPKTAAKWLARVRLARRDRRERRQDRRRGRREPARDARLAAAGAQAARRSRSTASCRSGPPTSRSTPPDNARLNVLFARFEFKQLDHAIAQARRADDAAGAIAAKAAQQTGRRFDEPERRRSGAGKPADLAYETVLDDAAFERWMAAIERAELVCFDTETDEPRPDDRAHRRRLVRDRAGQALLHPARASLSRCARPARPRRACSRAWRPGSRASATRKLGQNVKFDQHALANHGIDARRRRARHAAAVVRARVAQGARHGQPRVAPARLEDDPVRRGLRQGRRADLLRPGERRARDRVLGRGRRRHAAAASRRCIRASPRTRSSTASIARSRCRCARSCSAWSATAC